MTRTTTGPRLLLAALVLATLANAQEPALPPPPPAAPKGPAADIEALLTALDELHPFDARGRQFVRVARGEHGRAYGFVLARDERRCEVRLLDLGRRILDLGECRVEEVAPEQAADELLGRLAEQAERRFPRLDILGGFGHDLGAQAQAVVLARACRQRGDAALAERLLAAAPYARRGLERGLFRRLEVDFVDPECNWRELRDRHAGLVATFGSRGADDERLAAQLDDLVARLGDERTPPAFALLVDDLYHGREPIAFNSEWLQPVEPEPEADTPLEKYLARGEEVGPELIDLLEDPAPTRAVVDVARWQQLHPLTVGQRAANALCDVYANRGPRPIDGDQNPAAWRRWLAAREAPDSREAIAAIDAELAGRRGRRVVVTPRNRKLLAHLPDLADPMLYGACVVALLEDEGLRDDERLRAVLRRCCASGAADVVFTHLADRALEAGFDEPLEELHRRVLGADFDALEPLRVGLDVQRNWLSMLVRHGGRDAWHTIEAVMQNDRARGRLAHALLWPNPSFARVRDDEGLRTVAIRVLARLLDDEAPMTGPDATAWNVDATQYVKLIGAVRADAAAFALARIAPDRFSYPFTEQANTRHAQLPKLRAELAGR